MGNHLSRLRTCSDVLYYCNFVVCDVSCTECDGTTATDCTACAAGEFLLGDNSCQGIMDDIHDHHPSPLTLTFKLDIQLWTFDMQCRIELNVVSLLPISYDD